MFPLKTLLENVLEMNIWKIMLFKWKHSKQRIVQGEGCKDAKYMTPALKYVTLTFQGHYSMNITYTNFLQDYLVLCPLITSLVHSLSSSISSCLKVFPVLFTSCSSSEILPKSHVLCKALPDICPRRLKLSSEYQSYPSWVLCLWHLVCTTSN